MRMTNTRVQRARGHPRHRQSQPQERRLRETTTEFYHEDEDEEFVELTELRTVEHSRILEDYGLGAPSDGLKALRSRQRELSVFRGGECSRASSSGSGDFGIDVAPSGDEEDEEPESVDGDEEWRDHPEHPMDKDDEVDDGYECGDLDYASPETVQEEAPTMVAQEPPLREYRNKIADLIAASYLIENNNLTLDPVPEPTPERVPELAPNMAVPGAEPAAEELKKPEDEVPQEDEEEQSKRHRCNECGARFKGSGGLRNHRRAAHSSGPLFRCDDCGKEFPLKERLKLHVRTHTGYKPYRCPECDKRFARGGQLAQHRRTHSRVKPYRCGLCDASFTCAANLQLHLKRHAGQKEHRCPECGRCFVRRDALKKHLECLHRDLKSFRCHICQKSFKGHLPQHMRTHADDRPHGCATCGQRFAQKSQLTVHQRTHSGQRPFRCPVCWQAFAHSTALKLHTRRHTGERPFKCAECQAGFTQLPHWKKHMKCIHGRSEPYCCRGCRSFFRIKSELEAHEAGCAECVKPENSGEVLLATRASMTIERMRLLLAALLKRISRQERLDELGFGKRLIDLVLKDSLAESGKSGLEDEVPPAQPRGEYEALRADLGRFLEWTVPKEHWRAFKEARKSPEEILETLTAT